MTKWHGGKGSTPRPLDKEKFSSNWDKIFNNKNNKENNKNKKETEPKTPP